MAGASSTAASPALTNTAGQPENGRCGFGPRLPLLVISPYAKTNFVDHTLSDQASIPNFIEYNWSLPSIPGSADHLLTNPSSTSDLANMFDFSPGATDVAGASPYFLDTATFQPTTLPDPVLPETGAPLLLPIGAGVILGGGALVLGWRRRRASALPV
jgi:phospholipase C